MYEPDEDGTPRRVDPNGFFKGIAWLTLAAAGFYSVVFAVVVAFRYL